MKFKIVDFLRSSAGYIGILEGQEIFYRFPLWEIV